MCRMRLVADITDSSDLNGITHFNGFTVRLWSVFRVARPGKCHQALLFFTGCSNIIDYWRREELLRSILPENSRFHRLVTIAVTTLAWEDIIAKFCSFSMQNEAADIYWNFLLALPERARSTVNLKARLMEIVLKK